MHSYTIPEAQILHDWTLDYRFVGSLISEEAREGASEDLSRIINNAKWGFTRQRLDYLTSGALVTVRSDVQFLIRDTRLDEPNAEERLIVYSGFLYCLNGIIAQAEKAVNETWVKHDNCFSSEMDPTENLEVFLASDAIDEDA